MCFIINWSIVILNGVNKRGMNFRLFYYKFNNLLIEFYYLDNNYYYFTNASRRNKRMG